MFSPVPIVEYFSPDQTILLRQLNAALPCMAVPDDVGYPFAHRPGKNGGRLRRKDEGVRFDLVVDPCCGEELAPPSSSVSSLG